MFIIIFVPMNKVKLLVHRREVSIEQQQVVQARVIWYVPCNMVKGIYSGSRDSDRRDVTIHLRNVATITFVLHRATSQ